MARAIPAMVNPVATEDFPPPLCEEDPPPLLRRAPGGEGGDGPDDQEFPPDLQLDNKKVRSKSLRASSLTLIFEKDTHFMFIPFNSLGIQPEKRLFSIFLPA